MTGQTTAEASNDKGPGITSRRTLLWFPLAALLNAFSMTALLIVLGVTGYAELAASIGLVQGATLATFHVFQANARNLILADRGKLASSRLLQIRLFLLLPLFFIAYLLSVTVGGITPSLAVILLLRRGTEWFGELGLSQHERLNQKSFVQRAVFAEATGLLLCLVLFMYLGADFSVSAIPWAFAPLISVFRAQLSLSERKSFSIYLLLPHMGSTAIIGICVYVFRISVALLAGKAGAGELFTAFAIGGIIPTIFGQALAPTLMRRFGSPVVKSAWLLVIPASMLVVAGGVIMLAIVEPTWLVDTGRSSTFWLATGLSIAGGAVMIIALLLRAHLIHSSDEGVFGPDMLANILLVTLIPFIYFTLGAKSLAGLYLLGACLNLVYMSGGLRRKSIDGRFRIRFLFALGMLLAAPIFFQLEGGLFRDPAMVFDAGGKLLSLPIPISVLALFGAIAILGNYKVAKRSLTVVFLSVLLFVASALEGGVSAQEGSRLVLVSQFILPMFGLVLGEMFGAVARGPVFERAALPLLLVILPAQLMATWLAGYTDAQPLVFFFSIYQHLQYFPAIVAALATMASLALWDRSGSMRIAIGLMLMIVLVHLVASASINAIIGAVSGLAAFMTFHWRDMRFRRYLSATVVLALLAAAFYAALIDTDNAFGIRHSMAKGAGANWSVSATDGSSRAESWHVFSDGIGASIETFLIGHATRPDRNLYPNAHNYWLDAAYSFGVLSILPLVALIAMTAFLVWKQRSRVRSSPLLLGPTMAAAYLVLAESMFNIGMRQPYPGILTFFILGLLLYRLKPVK